MKELELYVHIPFCVKKCSYCDFLSAPAAESVRQSYTDQLQKEIRAAGPLYNDDLVISVFVGGGTPSVLTPSQMQRLFGQLRSSFHIRNDAEITVECNPGTMDAQKLKIYREAGVNRLSIGLQSAVHKELQLLGRIHTFEQFLQNYSMARDLGFQNINVDIMSGLPGQKPSDYEQTLKKVTALQPEHISAYSLIIEEGTPFYERYGQAELLRQKGKKQCLLPSEEEERSMYEITKQLLASAGYDRYEISNYAVKGFECRHNTGYWLRKNYLGVGLGAASLTDNMRFANTNDLSRYLQADLTVAGGASEGKKELSIWEQMEEFMFLGLRMMRGVSMEEFQKQFSRPMQDVYNEVLSRQLQEELIKKTKEGYALTDYGIDISNYVMSQYLFD